jgi:hypothetical protein
MSRSLLTLSCIFLFLIAFNTVDFVGTCREELNNYHICSYFWIICSNSRLSRWIGLRCQGEISCVRGCFYRKKVCWDRWTWGSFWKGGSIGLYIIGHYLKVTIGIFSWELNLIGGDCRGDGYQVALIGIWERWRNSWVYQKVVALC